jgi:hypothetical protein
MEPTTRRGLTSRKAGGDPLFSSREKQPLTRNGVTMVFARLRIRAEIGEEALTPQILRVTVPAGRRGPTRVTSINGLWGHGPDQTISTLVWPIAPRADADAHELADNFDKIADEREEDVEKDE